MHLLFLNLNQSRNVKKKLVLGIFLQKPNTIFWGVQNSSFKTKIRICFSAFVLYCKKKLRANFHVHWNFGFGLLKLYLTLGYLTSSVQSKKNSTLHPTVQCAVQYNNIPFSWPDVLRCCYPCFRRGYIIPLPWPQTLY